MIIEVLRSRVFGDVVWTGKALRGVEASRFPPRDPSKVRQDFNAPLNTTVHTLTKILAVSASDLPHTARHHIPVAQLWLQ